MSDNRYPSVFEYNSVMSYVHDYLDSETLKFLISVVKLIPKGADWQKVYIFDHDINLYKAAGSRENNRRCILTYEQLMQAMGLDYRTEPDDVEILEEYSEFDINNLDVAAVLKLLEFDLLPGLSGTDMVRDNSTRFLFFLRQIRNIGGHSSHNFDEVCECYDWMKKALNICERARDIFVNNYNADSKRAARLFSEYKELLKHSVNDVSIVVDRYILKEEDQYTIHPKLLYNYNIFVDETALESKYGSRYVKVLIDKFNIPVIVCEKTIESLRARIKNNTEFSEEAKDIIQRVLLTGDSINKNISIVKDTFNSIDSAEQILNMIKQKMSEDSDAEALFCVITERKYLAADVWSLKGERNSPIAIHATSAENGEFFCSPKKISVFFDFGEEADSAERQTGIQSAEASQESVGQLSIVFDDEPTKTEESTPVAPVNADEEKNASTPEQVKPVATSVNNTADITVGTAVKADSTASKAAPHTPQIVQRAIRMPKKGDTVIIDKGIFQSFEAVITSSGHSGGEGSIFSFSGYGSLIIKLYHKEPTPEQCEKLEAMVEACAEIDPNNSIFERICWPLALVYDRNVGNVIGYVMENISDGETLEDILTQMQCDEDNCKYQSRRELIDICLKICSRFNELHSVFGGKVLMGDVNPKNILVRSDGDVSFIDVDSYQYGKYLCPVGTPDFTSARLYKAFEAPGKNYSNVQRNRFDENFAIAVLIFYILFIKEYPFSTDDNLSLKQSIMNKYYVYNNENSKQARRSFIYKNLTDDMKEMFFTMFKLCDLAKNENDWVELLTMQSSAITEGRSTDELFPTSYLLSESDEFTTVNCRYCRKEFITSKESDMQSYCPSCLVKRALSRSRIYRMTCEICGKVFTANEWDISENFAEEGRRVVCPDCFPGLRLSKKSELNHNNDKFESNLTKHLSFAFRNFEERFK